MFLSMVLTVSVLTACSQSDASTPTSSTKGRVTFEGGVSLDVRIADDEDERRRGLMGVTSLPADEGMLFDFGGEPQTGQFWMKDTLIPLSIAFVDGERRIVSIAEMEPCDADPCPTYGSAAPYEIAIEANARWFSDAGIEVGDEIEEIDGPITG
jgi:uncharacterized protein